MSQPLQNFRTYELSILFYRECKKVKLPHALKDQLQRAATSITLNLAEGASRPSTKDRARFYSIAFGSLGEIQAIMRLESIGSLVPTADKLGAMLYKLSHPK